MKIKTKSLLRKEEYLTLSKLSINGRILDVGGSTLSGYHELIKGEHTFVVGNIDDKYGIDINFDAQKVWPFDKASFDGVLFINLLEHLFDYNIAISESYRVLKDGGIVAGVVPFMFNVHGSPNDYFRYTASSLEMLFKLTGFNSISVKELGSGAFSVIYHNLIGFVRWNWLASVLIPIMRLLDKVIMLIKPDNKMSAKYMPLGYYFEARK